MLNTTVSRLKCPRFNEEGDICSGTLELTATSRIEIGASAAVFEVRSGHLDCMKCGAQYPILSGVAIVVNDVRDYLLGHVKGISQVVPDSEIPAQYIEDFMEARAEIQQEHIEEDLEAERVNAIYVMTHYLRAKPEPKDVWWRPRSKQGSPLMDSLVREHWDQGPFAQVKKWVEELKEGDGIKLGCGVGGLYLLLKPHLRSYLGVDSSFASISLGRHLALGFPYQGTLKVPEDLLQGAVSREVRLSIPEPDAQADLIVGEIHLPPLVHGSYDLSIALNTIDMLDDPTLLPQLQLELLRPNGAAIQSCPYIWHESVARKLRESLPEKIKDSASAVEWLYEQKAFHIEKSVDHIPWLFFKHVRQLEIYSVHMLLAVKG